MGYFNTKLTEKQLNRRMMAMETMMTNYVNKVFEEGVKLPISDEFTHCIEDPRIRVNNGYILVDAEPYFQKQGCEFRKEKAEKPQEDQIEDKGEHSDAPE